MVRIDGKEIMTTREQANEYLTKAKTYIDRMENTVTSEHRAYLAAQATAYSSYAAALVAFESLGSI